MQIQVFPSLDSTQDEAKRQIQQTVFTEPSMIVAEEQTNGYGRFKRSFYSPKRGLYLTIIMPKNDVTCTSTLLTHATAVGLVSVLTSAGYCGVGIKWINDLYVQAHKVAGILVEQITIGEHTYYLVGVGLNVNSQSIPTELDNKMGTLNQNSSTFHDPIGLIPDVQRTLTQVYCLEDDVILAHYRQASIMIGRQISAEVGHETIVGKVIGFNQTGGLILATNTSDVHINTGEVVRITL